MKKVIRSFHVGVAAFDSAPYGDMHVLSVFWYDGLREEPEDRGVPFRKGWEFHTVKG